MLLMLVGRNRILSRNSRLIGGFKKIETEPRSGVRGDMSKSSNSYVQPAGRMRQVEGFVQPSLGLLCSETILHDNLSLFW